MSWRLTSVLGGIFIADSNKYRQWKKELEKYEHPPPRKKAVDKLLTEEIKQKIVGGVYAGNFPDVVAQAVKISKQRFNTWMNRGAAESIKIDEGIKPDPREQLYLDFYTEVESAFAMCEMRAVSAIMNPKESDTIDLKWAAWWLEHARKHNWAPGKDVNFHGPNGGPIQMEAKIENDIISGLTADEIDRIAEILIDADNRRIAEACDDQESLSLSQSGLEEDRSEPVHGQLAHPAPVGMAPDGDSGEMHTINP